MARSRFPTCAAHVCARLECGGCNLCIRSASQSTQVPEAFDTKAIGSLWCMLHRKRSTFAESDKADAAHFLYLWPHTAASTAPQSLTTKPSKAHWLRSVSLRILESAQAGTPFTCQNCRLDVGLAANTLENVHALGSSCVVQLPAAHSTSACMVKTACRRSLKLRNETSQYSPRCSCT